MSNNEHTASLLTALDIELILAFSEIITSTDITDKVRELRFLALKKLQTRLDCYKKLGYKQRLLDSIAEKKCQMILQISTKTEMEEAINPHCPRFDGNKFIPDIYNVPEEELICWSATSLSAPLNEIGFKRYVEVFKTVFPEESSSIPL